MIHGRDREQRLLAERLDGLRAGRGFGLLVDGPAGIGKSTLLAGALERAAPRRALRLEGYASEAEIAFGGLLTLLTPLLPARHALPPAQRDALEAALALAAPAPYDPFALRVAVAALLAVAAEEEPLLVAVDDAQWLDEDSLAALVFAARRPAGDGVGLLLATRDAEGGPLAGAGIERLTLAPLDASDARRLIADAADVAPAVVPAVLRAAGGNPLALRELPRALTDAQRRGEEALAEPLAAGGPVVAAFARTVRALPADEQTALALVAATGGHDDRAAAALRELALPGDVLDRLLARELLERAGPFLRPRHPLLGAAAYDVRPRVERRAVHRALAAVSTDAARRAWHLAHAAAGPDDAVAHVLEETARGARSRGGHAEAARAFRRAAELSIEPRAAERRRLEAAADFALSGHGAVALELADDLADAAVDPASRLAARRLQAHLRMRGGDPVGAIALLEELAAHASSAGDHAAAAQMLLEASMTHMFGGDMQALQATAERARVQAAQAGPELEVVAALAVGEALVALGDATAGDALIARAEPLMFDADPLEATAEIIGMGAMCSMWIGRFDRAQRTLDGLVARARAAGAAGRLPYPLAVRSQLAWRRGRWTAAVADADEAVRLARDTGQEGMLAVALPALARALAGRGDIDAARRLGEEGVAVGEAAAGDATVVHSLAALGFVELTDGRPASAAGWLDRAAAIAHRYAHAEPALTLFAADHVEALTRAGRLDEAVHALERLEEQATRTGGAWAAAVAARGRVLLCPGDEIDTHAAAALAAHARIEMPFEQARTELAIGERLRRDRRRGEAREPLARAARAFDRLSAVPWADRARIELEVGGIRAVQQDADAPLSELTANELQIALLVADGSSNADVAAALFLSRKTIEHHLTAIYRKLGLRSRTQLAALVAEERAAVR
jgi:ATP/maltotriose-dependent transcriptional regulator MalT